MIECPTCGAEHGPGAYRCEECGKNLAGVDDDDSDASPLAVPDGGAKYVNPTADGYLGTYAVSVQGSCTLTSGVIHEMGWSPGDGLWLVDVEEGVEITTTEPSEYLQVQEVTGDFREDPGINFGGRILRRIGSEPGGDVRVYRRGTNRILVVDAYDDPLVATDGGNPPGPTVSQAGNPTPDRPQRYRAFLGDDRHLCDICGRVFSELSELRNHDCQLATDGGRYRRDEVRSQRRTGQRLDQGACPHVSPGELPCNNCFFGGDDSA
jgi:hypothetical protein